MPSWTIAIGCDDAGSEYKAALQALLEADPRVKQVIDCGMDKVYPHVGVAVGRKIAEGKADRGLLICGTGMGVAIAANKVPGIRSSGFYAYRNTIERLERLVKSNNAQVLALGQRVIGIELAKQLTTQWLGHEFDPSSASAAKVQAICDYEK